MTKIKKFNELKESKEQDKIDELLDKGFNKLSDEEKSLLARLSKGEKLIDAPKPISPPTGGGPSKQKEKYKEGDSVVYIGGTREFSGKKAKFVRVKEDGKYTIVFDSGKKLVVNPKNIMPYNKDLDPYGEENWGEENRPRGGGNFLHGGGPNNAPSDFKFNVQQFDQQGEPGSINDVKNRIGWDDVAIVMCEIADPEGMDSLGSHSLSRAVIDALNRSGVYGEVEAMEAVWECLPGRTVEFVRQRMIEEGFVYDPQLWAV